MSGNQYCGRPATVILAGLESQTHLWLVLYAANPLHDAALT